MIVYIPCLLFNEDLSLYLPTFVVKMISVVS